MNEKIKNQLESFPVIIVFLIIIGGAFYLYSKKVPLSVSVSIYDDPVVTDWHDETFVVEEPIKKIGGTGLGRVVVRRVDVGRGHLFSAIVATQQDIHVGSVVKIKIVEYVDTPHSIISFMVAVKPSP